MGVDTAIRTLEQLVSTARASREELLRRQAIAQLPTANDLPEDGLWTAKEVAAYLKTSLSWVRHRSAAGLLPCIRIGALVRFDPEVIRKLGREGAKAR